MRIGIVNDMPMAVEILRRVVREKHEVAWTAMNGEEAVECCAKDLPDLVLMDLIMPVMDGVEATRRIMRQSPCPILIVTSSIDTNTAKVFDALGGGALDVVLTPAMMNGATEGSADLLRKIDTLRLLAEPVVVRTPRPNSPERFVNASSIDLLAIGSSAGGPTALAEIFARLSPDFRAAIVVVQHIDAEFAPGLASWLATQTALPVRVAREGDRPQIGTILIAGTNDHLILREDGTLSYTREPAELFYRPSVDVFFDSVARHWRGRIVGVLLTGMGRDGAAGLKGLRVGGTHTMAQDRQSSTVYGMPKAAAELGAADEIVALSDMARAIQRALAR